MRVKIYDVFFLLLLLVACDKDFSRQKIDVPEGMVQVDLWLAGVYDNLSPFAGRSGNLASRSGTVDSETLEGKPKHFLPDGTTLWILVQKIGSGDLPEGDTEFKSYIVRSTEGGTGSSLYPCVVNEDGTPKLDPATGKPIITDSPFFLEYGTYLFTALSPARKLEDNKGLVVSNGEYLISTDNRYQQTQQTKVLLEEDGRDVVIITLNPLINQTAQLKFTLYADDVYVHDLDVMPAGTTVSGLQSLYNLEGETWNWQLGDTLKMSYGDKSESYTQYSYTRADDGAFVVDVGILPTNAISTPLVVLFNLKVNGIPTIYEMMLNEKIFKAGYSYHYKGKVTIQEGVSAIVWQSVSWSTDVDLGGSSQNN